MSWLSRLDTSFTNSQDNEINKIKTQTATTEPLESISNKIASLDDNAITINLSERAIQQKKKLTLPTSYQTDDMSLLKTANDSLNEIQSLLQYGKALVIQATQTESTDTKQFLQNELTRISEKIDNISHSTEYKNTNLFVDSNELSVNDKKIIQCLKSDWLEEAEKLVLDRYGLSADGANLKIVLDETPQQYLAAIEYHYGTDGKATNQILHIAVDTALPANLPDGGEHPYYDDRVISHEMVHAIMGRTMNFSSLPNWFKEGTAEFIHGANERVATDLARNGGGIEGAKVIQNALGDGTNNTWVGNSIQYSSSAMAVRYLHEQIQADGHSGGIKDLLNDLKNNPTEDLDQALSHVSNYADTRAFVNDFVANGNGASFIHKLEQSCELTKTLLGGDTGGIGGSSVDGGPIRTAKSVVPDIYYPNEKPLKHFNVIWPTQDNQIKTSIPLTTTENGTLNYTRFKIDSKVLNLNNVDLVNAPDKAIISLDNAMSYISKGQIYINTLLGTLATNISATIKNNITKSTQLLALHSRQDPISVLDLIATP
ncbi:flagellinolysin [Sporomusa sp. KB1]|jgi:flagellin|uniref:flagellinolysin n=1 Tax=Sporomusa sp. KB1 TaxID=943346 RepID=UPI0011A3ACEC|nr:flagellinolysin [Sporomusa sp. KB1]TWH45049.1 flagellin [Sporomusa sp. KB1]